METLSKQYRLRALRKRTAEVLYSADPNDALTHRVDIFLIVMISLNIIAIIIESMPGLHQSYGVLFYAFEFFSVIIFSIEYVARVWSAVDNPWHDHHSHAVFGRMKYVKTPMAIIDLLAIAPFYLSFFFILDLRFLRVLRLLRVFKLTRYSPAMTLLLQVFREEAKTIMAAMFVLMMLIIIASSLAFIAEHDAVHANPDAFSSIPAAMYWAIITMTTVGYGDVVPVTPFGKLLGAVIGIVGLGMVALPAGILASGFSNALHRRRAQLEDKVTDILSDGVISDAEEEELATLLQNLNLNPADAKALIFAAHNKDKTNLLCPHCGKPINQPPHDDD
ncbi:MAG: ion transporter [Rhodospirillaceae bacterium]|nr:ion transporter [Rhodospirillaceae bacterium]